MSGFVVRASARILVLGLLVPSALGYEAPRPGDPAALLDWRWLARQQSGERRFSNDPWGERKLPPCDGGYLALDVEGPGVLDHLWSPVSAGAYPIVEVDGKPQDRPPEPLAFEGGGMRHMVAPIGFQNRLRLIAAKPQFAHFASYRVFPKDTAVALADAAALKAAAALWAKGGPGLHEGKPGVEQPFVLPAKGRVVAFERKGSGEVIALEFHVNPALTGTLREVVAEVTCDGGAAPSLRMPLPDLAGVPHPWPAGRWDRYNGDLAAGLRYPWYMNTPRVYFPEATVHFNLPIPFADGLRIELVNRSGLTQFVGYVRAVVLPLAADEAARAGRLCGTRRIAPVRPGAEPQPLIALQGPGQVVGLGLFLTGNARWPAAVHESRVSLRVDGRDPIVGQGLVPLWFQGIYGGPILDRVIWNHPRLEEGYAGAMRHFLTDPIPFERDATFGFTPGPKPEGAPTEATVVALWYRFGPKPYEAPALPEQAEPLPYSVFDDAPMKLGPAGEPARLAWAVEAEDLAPLAVAHETELRVVEDSDHNYHPSAGRYLHVVADRPGGYVDFAVRLPASRYVAIGVYPLWGPGRGTFELDVLSRAVAKEPPSFLQGDAYVQGRILGSVPMKAPVFTGNALDLRRDPGCHHTPPILNPAPDRQGVLRLICQAKPLDSNSHLLKLDRIRMDAPPPTATGWLECEELPTPAVSGGLTATVRRYGRFDWSGWGALLVASPAGGNAALAALVPTGPAKVAAVRLKGCLGPEQGTWQARVAGRKDWVALQPGKDAEQVVEWVLPASGVVVPGPVTLDLSCTAAGKVEKGPTGTPGAQLALDVLSVR